MRVLVFHGYLLSGTGSNVYNASLAGALRSLGHEVHLLCQEPDPAALGFVDALGEWKGGELRVREIEPREEASGSLSVYRPDIGGLLPVFVRDSYAGFEVKTFTELTDEELERYVDLNVAAVRDVVAQAGAPDAALANHLVMAPVILARAGIEFALKVHGSDLSYTILPELERFGSYAREGARAATGILVGSGHISDRLRQAVDEPEVNAKVALGPPGVDIEVFAPLAHDQRSVRLGALAKRLEAIEPAAAGGEVSSWDRDTRSAAAAIRWFAADEGTRVIFVGKLIVSKGVDLLLAAWPLVHARHPGARLLIAGFGAYRDGLERLDAALGDGDLDAARAIAVAGRTLEGGPEGELRHLGAFLADPPGSYAETARGAAGSVEFAGRLEHSEVGELVPATDALVFPSTHPEAFGMVAAEAAAAGVLPVSAAHSGALEVSRALAAELPSEAARLLSFTVDDGAVVAIAECLCGWLELEDSLRERSQRALIATAARLWGWEGVAEKVLSASRRRR